jgi:hypothetical protein
VIFDHKSIPSYLHVLFRGTYWARFWSLRLKEEDCLVMKNLQQWRSSPPMVGGSPLELVFSDFSLFSFMAQYFVFLIA